MRFISLVILFVSFSAANALASDPKLIQLEAKVRELETTIRSLEAETKKLRNELAHMRNIADPDVSGCSAREAAQVQLLAKLQSLGYGSSHPDIIKTETQLAAIKEECGSEGDTQPSSLTVSRVTNCLERLTELRVLKDRLSTLGFTQSHPDVQNLDAQINDVSTSCPSNE